MDSCFAVDWIKVLETDEPEGFQVDFPIPNIYFLDNHLYIQGQGTYRKNYFWLPEPRNVATSSIFKFNLDGQLINTIPLFTDYQIIKSYGIQQFDSTSLIQFSYGMHTRNLDQGENGWRRRPIYTILDTGLNIIRQEAFYHFSDTTATFRSHLKLNEYESLFGGNFTPRPHPNPIRHSIPFIAKVNTSTGKLLFTKNFESYNEKRRDGYVSDFVNNKHGTVAIVTTLVNDQNGEIFDTSSISFVQLEPAFNELQTYEFRPINKELAYIDHTMQNDSVMYLLASIATRPENGVVFRSESAIFKVNINTFEVLDWDSVGLPTDSFCVSEVIYEDGDIDFEPFYINRNYVDSSLLSVSNFTAKTLGIYPNPAKDKIKLKENLHGYNYKITNLLGRLVAEGVLENEIDVSMINNGLYILELSDKNTKYRAKFYKQE